MKIFPAIDIYAGRAVRLLHGDYAKMTVYNENPLAVAQDFIACGAKNIHIVDLEGAKTGETPNLALISKIAACGLFADIIVIDNGICLIVSLLNELLLRLRNNHSLQVKRQTSTECHLISHILDIIEELCHLIGSRLLHHYRDNITE